MARTIGAATESLLEGQASARAIAERLEDHLRENETAWRNYEERFGDVDEALSAAVTSLAQRTAEQQQNIAEFVLQIDQGCGEAVQKLRGIASSLEQNTAEISDTFSDFLEKMAQLNDVAVGA